MSESRPPFRVEDPPGVLPPDGKVVVLAPAIAARAAEQHPEHANRVYTLPDLEPWTAYVIDLDKANELFGFDRRDV